jgi:DNA adenine methylase
MSKNVPIALRYHGGKTKIHEWIISHFPPHKTYVEPFGGGASVLLNKSRVTNEIYNDINSEIVNVFKILRNKNESSKLLELLSKTLYSRDEFNLSYEITDDNLEQARNTIVRSMMAFGGNVTARDKTGFIATANNNTSAPMRWIKYTHQLPIIINRLREVTIENRDALELIDIYDSSETLFYLDPPYVTSSRKTTSKNYAHEMTDEDHIALANLIKTKNGKFIISGYHSKLYDELYKGWKCVEKQSMAASYRGGVPTTEVLWISPTAEIKNLFTVGLS